MQGIIHSEFVQCGSTVNAAFYVKVMQRLREIGGLSQSCLNALKIKNEKWCGARDRSCDRTSPGWLITIIHFIVYHSLSESFWQSTRHLLSHNHPIPLIRHQPTSSSSISKNQPSKIAVSRPYRRSRINYYRTSRPFQNWSSSRHSRTGRNTGSNECTVEGSILKQINSAKR